MKQSLTEEMREHLQFVEKHNTWKALLQLLYEEDFQDLAQFHGKIDSLSEVDLKYICLPFLGRSTKKKNFSGKWKRNCNT